MSEHLDVGCRQCNCSSIGSYSELCDGESGQCSCKSHFTGLKCDQIEKGFFCPKLDFVRYEAEDAKQVNEEKSMFYQRIDDTTNLLSTSNRLWTGTGSMRVFDGGQLVFNIKHEKPTGLYDIILRYETYEDWKDVRFEIINKDFNNNLTMFYYQNRKHLNLNKDDFICAKFDQQKQRTNSFMTSLKLTKFERSRILFPLYCFQSNRNYEIKISFNYDYDKRIKKRSTLYKSGTSMPKIFVDSVKIYYNKKSGHF
jgi:hypothetical protein